MNTLQNVELRVSVDPFFPDFALGNTISQLEVLNGREIKQPPKIADKGYDNSNIVMYTNQQRRRNMTYSH